MLFKRLLLLVLAVIFSGCIATPRNELPQPLAVQHALNSTIMLMHSSYRDGELFTICAGEYISPNQIATAYHCIDSAVGCDEGDEICMQNGTVAFLNRQDYLMESEQFRTGWVSKLDKLTDLAVIDTPFQSEQFVQMEVEPPAIGERVFSIGHPRSHYFRIVEGYLKSQLVVIPEPALEVDIEIGPGSSGGGLYNSDGNLVGVCSAMRLDGKVGYFIPTLALQALLARPF